MVKERAKAKFDETIEIAMNLASIPSTPTRWCAAWSTCRTAPAARCGSACSPAAPRPTEARPPVPRSLVGAAGSGREGQRRRDQLRPLHRHPRHDGPGRTARQRAGAARPDAQSARRQPATMDVTNAVKGARRLDRASASRGRNRAGPVLAGLVLRGDLVANIKAFVDAVARPSRAGAKGHYINRVRDLLDLWARASKLTRPRWRLGRTQH